jgi:thioredoxin 1
MATANVAEFTADNWEQEVVKSTVPVVVDFWAPWCGPCRQLGPTIDRIADQFVGKVKVGKLNTDESPELAAKYRITGIPQVLIFKGSDQPQERVVGVTSEASLVKLINRVLGQ